VLMKVEKQSVDVASESSVASYQLG
jgi:hypothetical protein